MDINWAVVLGGVALVWIGSERALGALLRSKRLPAIFAALTESWPRAWATGVGLAAVAPGSDRLQGLPGALARCGRLRPTFADSLATGVSWSSLCVFALVAASVPFASSMLFAALGLAGLGFLSSRVGQRGAWFADLAVGCAATLGGATAISMGFTALALSPVELPWSWTAQLCASCAAGCVVMLVFRSEGVVIAFLTGAAVSSALDPYSSFAAMLGVKLTGSALLAWRDAPSGTRWWLRDGLVAHAVATLFGCFALAWAVVFGARLPATLQRPVWLVGSLLVLVAVAHTAVAVAYAKWRGDRSDEGVDSPRPNDVGLAPLLAWDGALTSLRRTSTVVRSLVTARLKGAVVDAARMRRCSSEVDRSIQEVNGIGAAAIRTDVPGWLGDTLRAVEQSAHSQAEVVTATGRLTTELSDERALGSFAARVRQAKQSVLNYVASCDDYVQSRSEDLPTDEHDAVRERLIAVREVILSATSTQNPRMANKVLEDVRQLEAILDHEQAACMAIAGLELSDRVVRSERAESILEDPLGLDVDAALPSEADSAGLFEPAQPH